MLFLFQVIPNYSSKDQYDKMFALGVTMYGQMTAGSYCYIGPQGIVHGTTVSTVMLRMLAKFKKNVLPSTHQFITANVYIVLVRLIFLQLIINLNLFKAHLL